MAGSGDHIKALVRNHASGDDASFYAVATQIAAQEARRGHTRLANDLKQTIDASRREPVTRRATPIARPTGELADLLTASFPDTGIRDLIGPEELLDLVREVITEQRQRNLLKQKGFAPIHRLLLAGPPGTGKTLTAQVLAHELSLPLLTVRLDSLMSKFLGETASKLRLLFDAAAEQRAVYLFDEFDALGGERTGNDVGEARRILNSFLIFLEQASPREHHRRGHKPSHDPRSCPVPALRHDHLLPAPRRQGGSHGHAGSPRAARQGHSLAFCHRACWRPQPRRPRQSRRDRRQAGADACTNRSLRPTR